jgi:cell division protein FtsI/penicillin-binding protein 2
MENGNDVYLTVDVGIQKEVESIIKPYYDSLKADSISVLVYDPMS